MKFNIDFRKTAQFFPSSKEKSFSSMEKFPTSKDKNPSSKEVFRRKDTKKGGLNSPPFTYANIQHFSANSKSAFRAIFTKVNSFDPPFAISELTKKAVFADVHFDQKIEMHEKNQSKNFGVL